MNAITLITRTAKAKGLLQATTNRKSFTLIELLVVVAIIAVLVAILLPALQSARENAKTTICLSRQHQVCLALMGYADDFNQWLPPHYLNYQSGNRPWTEFLKIAGYIPWGVHGEVFRCPRLLPDDGKENPSHWASYGLAVPWRWVLPPEQYRALDRLETPARFIIVTDVVGPQNSGTQSYLQFHRTQFYVVSPHHPDGYIGSVHLTHKRRANILFADGHSTTLTSQGIYAHRMGPDRWESCFRY